MRKCFFFDRDGVLNKSIVKNGKPYSPTKISELIIDDDAQDIIRYLKSNFFNNCRN